MKRFRNTPEAMFRAFDAADGLRSAPARMTTVTPSQALLLMNGDWTRARAQAWAESLAELSRSEAVARAVASAWGRSADPVELARLDAFAQEHSLGDLCHVLLNSNAFLYVD